MAVNLQEHQTHVPSQVLPFPNRFKHAEFAEYAGERLLQSILRKILPSALYRTWDILVSRQAYDDDCFLSIASIAEMANRAERTIRLDIHEMQERKLLQLRPEHKLLRNRDGSTRLKMVIVKDFSTLYDLAHEYYAWQQSDCPIPAAREFADIIRSDEDLRDKLIRFDNYRKILENRIPGPKRKDREVWHWYTDYDPAPDPTTDVTSAEQQNTSALRQEQLREEFQKEIKKHPEDRIISKDQRDGITRWGFEFEGSHVQKEREDVFSLQSGLQQANILAFPTSDQDVLTTQIGNDQAAPVSSNSETEISNATNVTSRAMPAPRRAKQDKEVEQQKKREKLQLSPEVASILAALGQRFDDRQPLSSRTRLAKLQHRAGLSDTELVDYINLAADKTRAHVWQVQGSVMGYFFEVLRKDIKADMASAQPDTTQEAWFPPAPEPIGQSATPSETEIILDMSPAICDALERDIRATYPELDALGTFSRVETRPSQYHLCVRTPAGMLELEYGDEEDWTRLQDAMHHR